MSKKLIVGIALSLVLVSGSFFGAQADCGLNPCGWNLNPCGWHLPSLCGFHMPSFCGFGCGSKDTDKRDLDKSQDRADKY